MGKTYKDNHEYRGKVKWKRKNNFKSMKSDSAEFDQLISTNVSLKTKQYEKFAW